MLENGEKSLSRFFQDIHSKQKIQYQQPVCAIQKTILDAIASDLFRCGVNDGLRDKNYSKRKLTPKTSNLPNSMPTIFNFFSN